MSECTSFAIRINARKRCAIFNDEFKPNERILYHHGDGVVYVGVLQDFASPLGEDAVAKVKGAGPILIEHISPYPKVGDVLICLSNEGIHKYGERRTITGVDHEFRSMQLDGNRHWVSIERFLWINYKNITNQNTLTFTHQSYKG